MSQKNLVIDRRDHIAGNCYTAEVNGIHVHKYGPHIFHTSDVRLWAFVNQFARFNHFTYRPRVIYRDRLYSFPISMMTLYQLWGVTTPGEAEESLQRHRIPCANPRNLEEWCLSQVGAEIYETFIQGYTTKQWGRQPRELPASLVRRLPIRLTYDDKYFNDPYQGIPVGGYSAMVENMLQGTEVRLSCDFFEDRSLLRRIARRVVYSGPIDRYFDFRFGSLQYRSLRFEEDHLPGDLQGVAVVNHTDAAVPYTRVVEHKHFTFSALPHTVITREYPTEYDGTNEPLYPINDARNNTLYRRYSSLAERSADIFGGRMGTYRYYDMHQVIAQAITTACRELSA